MKKPRVLMLNTNPMLYDGITRVIQNFISNMDRSDIVVDVVANNKLDESIKKIFVDMGCEVYHLYRNTKNILSYISNLTQIIKNGKYDIVHVHCNSCTAAIELLAAYLGGVKVRIAHCHNTSTRHQVAHKIFRPMFDRLCTDRFACGKEAGQWLYPKKDFVVWNNAVDTELFQFNAKDREEIRATFKLEDKVAVGHVANFIEQKNHLFLFDVWRGVVDRNDNYILFLIGGGHNRKMYEKMVCDLNLQDNVVFTGGVKDVQRYLSAMDLMVLPSLYEGLPCVAIEWQCSGLPSLIADTVTTECKLTKLVSFVPLKKEKWIEAILSTKSIENRIEQSVESIREIKRTGFSVKENAQRLKQYYLDALARVSLKKEE